MVSRLRAARDWLKTAIVDDPELASLREAIARHHDVDVDRAVCGFGSDDLLQLLARGALEEAGVAIGLVELTVRPPASYIDRLGFRVYVLGLSVYG